MITRPELPPKRGYVEVEIGGVRRYRSVATGMLLGEEPASPAVEEVQAELDTAQKKLDAAIQSNAMLEDCLVEMAQVVYA